jgi:class 3 adenylate cyclase/TolB-like protein/ketosteroid isomerase-like protein
LRNCGIRRFYVDRRFGYKSYVDPGGYTRRVLAILLADVSGFSALMGQDDERTARDVRRIQKLVATIGAEHGGHADPQAGDAVAVRFESVVSAVRSALQVQEQLAREATADRQLRLRIGIHFGDLLVEPGGTALGDAINVAARLCALARPGTICVSDGVYRHVRGRFNDPVEDLGRQRLKNISDPVHAYLIVPRGAERARRRRHVMARVVGAVGALVVGSALWLFWPRHGAPPGIAPALRSGGDVAQNTAQTEVTLGVMLFKPLRDDTEHVWMREALRDGLNTQLSGLSKVKIYSKEFIDLLITKQGLSEIEAANKLRITKMLSGSFVVVDDALRIETHVVDVASGMIETSYTTTGPTKQFLTLQTKMTEGVIARLDLPITPDERRTLLAQQNTDVEALKMLLEAEGGAPVGPPSPPGPGSSLRRWMDRLPTPDPAWADDRADIAAVLEAYRKATEAHEIAAVAAVYLEFSPDQQAAQQRYLDNVKDLKIVISDVDAVVVGDDAVVSYTRTDDFTDARTGRPLHVQVRLTKNLKRTESGWKLAAGK